jgi:hypothetical protein
MRRHVLIPRRHISSIGSKYRSFLPTGQTQNFAMGSMMRSPVPTLIGSLREAPPTRPSRPRLGTRKPLISDREALRASAHSLCSLPGYLYILAIFFKYVQDSDSELVHFENIGSPYHAPAPFPLGGVPNLTQSKAVTRKDCTLA